MGPLHLRWATLLSLAASLGNKLGPLHLRCANLLSQAASLGTKQGPLHLRWANLLSLAASLGTRQGPLQYSTPAVGKFVKRLVKGPTETKNGENHQFLPVFWPLLPRASTQPNEIHIICSHILGSLPQKI